MEIIARGIQDQLSLVLRRTAILTTIYGTVRAQEKPIEGSATMTTASMAPARKMVIERQGHMEKMFTSFNIIAAEMMKDKPDVALIHSNTLTLKTQAAALPSWFPQGTGAKAGIKTRAKTSIWTDASRFAAEAEKLRVETSKLEALANAGNLPDMVDRIGRVSDACGECHTEFRDSAKRR